VEERWRVHVGMTESSKIGPRSPYLDAIKMHEAVV
jgi:hypothetical protein